MIEKGRPAMPFTTSKISLLLLSSALAFPIGGAVLAQTAPPMIAPPTPGVSEETEPETVDTVIPGAEDEIAEETERVDIFRSRRGAPATMK